MTPTKRILGGLDRHGVPVPPTARGERVRVTEAELKVYWFSSDAAGMMHDHQTRTKVVRMRDGTEYETPSDELTRDES